MLSLYLIAGPLLALGGLFLAAWRQRRRRRVQLQALAQKRGMSFRESGLPAGMDLRGTLFARVARVWNVIEGRVRGTDVVVFDCVVGEGKTPWRTTVYGVRDRSSFGARAGSWYVQSKGRIWLARLDSVAEIESQLENL